MTFHKPKLDHLRTLAKLATADWVAGRRQDKWCVHCRNSVHDFLPYRGIGKALASDAMVSLGIVGSDLDHFECPVCHSMDRDRHFILYLEATGLYRDLVGKRILHLAPEPALSALLRNLSPRSYSAASYEPSSLATRREDLMALGQADASIDAFVCNHVLEHVPNDSQAFSEISRILCDGAIAILQTPFARKLQQTLDAPLANDYQRLLQYGQEDHLRLFGTDFWSKAAAAGLDYIGGEHHEILPDWDPAIHGVNADEPFMAFKRRPRPRS